jgi:hypothetical protein
MAQITCNVDPKLLEHIIAKYTVTLGLSGRSSGYEKAAFLDRAIVTTFTNPTSGIGTSGIL